MKRLLLVSSVLPVLAGVGLVAVPSGGLSSAPPVAHVDAAVSTPHQPTTWSKADHDGVGGSRDVADLDKLPKVHAVYLHASDRPSRFAEYAAYFQAEHRKASAHVAAATGMAVRWDERRAADGRLLHDISVVRSRSTFAELSNDATQWQQVLDALAAAKLTSADKKYLVWVDADSAVCGQASRYEDARRSSLNHANLRTVATMNRPRGTSAYSAVGGFCAPVVHELTHAFGGVASYAPNYYSNGHCMDEGNDFVCLSGGHLEPFDPAAPREWDHGNDDYLDPAADLALPDTAGRLPWWTVNLSRFLCPRSSADRTVPDCSRPNDPVY